MPIGLLGGASGALTPVASFLSGGGTPAADVVAIVISLVAFALLYWVIDLVDRI